MTSLASKTRILVVGNGMVGHHFVEQLHQSSDNVDITVLCGESRLAYDRVHLSSYFSGASADDLALTTADVYREWGVNVVTNAIVTDLLRDEKKALTEDGQVFPYDKLVLATGSYPFVPPIPGNDQEHCLVYRTIDDLIAIENSARESKVGVVVGGGLLGLEAANALKEAGLETHVVEFAPQLMAVQLDETGGDVLRSKIESLGVTVHTQKATQVIEAGEQSRYRMVFADGTFLETDMVLFSAGIRPSDQLARKSMLALGERGGIVVDDNCLTSDPDIFAVGECALWQNRIFGLVAPGYTMARAAVSALAGGDTVFTGADMSTKLKLMGVEVGSIGDAHERTTGAQSYTYFNQPEGVYKKLVVDESQQKVLGAVLVGDTSDYDTLLQYALNGIDLPENPETLILPSAGAAPALGADALPDTATICSCHNVAKSDIVSAIDEGCCSLSDVKSCTKASTGCGGCTALLKNVVDSELEKRGVEVSKAICEHFNHTRQELFHIVKVNGITSFDELLDKHGTGLGCEICKPAAGSILASVYNDYVLKQEHLPLQDTNDIYLGNMQKDGTYSVVPRVAGGEITPEKLILLGEVAKKYSLYTKITGGQRIDLFGARVDQLPDIWEALVKGGFETGHAYAKALRTVKSCVGSTWCRYGVQDSVKTAIDLENRYKGLRAPHKIKFGVSGCTRECAEAQSKDIGVIATENGWNLYVCGNGGMKPRHADLFATDLDTETLVKYIDRVLMFYVRTADRLQRTSVWMDNLEGGLAYLQDVVMNDSLNINADLEAQMETVVGAYQCEWKTTLESEASRKRFRQFVNTDGTDTNIQFVSERGQVRPATELEKSKGADNLIAVDVI
ncbi:nitrite reductase (NAD(P)H) [Alteromonas sp. KS69]|jgi:nitrite reductase (NADH) large subunit|uniref:nitrite reductase large subunit NirB n=1 Tax=unclassified Alteromonas TaxID=2614992 RepID=UPI000C47BF92|nr:MULTISPECIES: nitrite reductase large subunit NirB [unclassified Alteromonas]MBB67676.1 nitrite reductase (NAD(P)H) [Rickettsiales bacterium]MBO7922101.1 nitrite reductase large subunit [Alteromonas sp. K632G]RUP81226.1 nitrite reductase (NAD(P)H) [Alteromonas sp. KS69]|tara:strand:- start:20490 stop:23039 length:2550 start_codon:yes stop_codon:yes gene_type:complete